LRASAFYATSYHPLYGDPADPRLLSAFAKQTLALNRGLALSDPPVMPVRIPFESASLPAYMLPAEGRQGEPAPLLILTNGYDATMTDMYFASAVAATRRGYHCLMFDGPGQGGALYEQGLHLRHDWETVVAAVVDFAVQQHGVDPDRIALSGWSLGGYLAARAASGEHRLAACIVDPPVWSLAGGFRAAAIRLGIPLDAAADLGALDDAWLDRFWQVICNDRRLQWTVVKRGFWVHGVNSLRGYLRSAELFTMDGRVESIRCPTLVTVAEGDALAASAQPFYDALMCPKRLIRFTAAEGAGGHCEMQNRSLFNLRALDWLDEVFAASGKKASLTA
jgi:pimeloyl-ACP methyl ester carboxylesterase